MPWAGHVLRRSRGVIVHSDFGRRYIEELGSRTPVFVVPHPVVESDADMERARRHAPALRAPLEARGARTVIVAPGDLNEAKQLGALLAAARLLPEDVHVVMVGRRIEGYDADREVAASGLGGRVTLAPDVSDDDFLRVAVRGRRRRRPAVPAPRRGERLARARDAGRARRPSSAPPAPTSTCRTSWCCGWRRARPTRASWRRSSRVLIDDRGLRVRMGAAARDHVEEAARLGGDRARVRAGDRGDPRAWSAIPSARPRPAGPAPSPTSASARPRSAPATASGTRGRSRASGAEHRRGRPNRHRSFTGRA